MGPHSEVGHKESMLYHFKRHRPGFTPFCWSTASPRTSATPRRAALSAPYTSPPMGRAVPRSGPPRRGYPTPRTTRGHGGQITPDGALGNRAVPDIPTMRLAHLGDCREGDLSLPIAGGVLAAQGGVGPVSHDGWIQRVGSIQGTASTWPRIKSEGCPARWRLSFRRVICAHVNAVARSSENGGL